MKAAVMRQFGGPEVLRLEDVAIPRPRAGEVLVKILAAGVNRLDHYVREGSFSRDIPLPHILGSDAVGEVVEGGTEATRFSVGERVVLMPGYPRDDREAQIRPANAAASYVNVGVHVQGVYAQYCVIPERWAARDVTGLIPAETATLPMTLLTAVRAVQRTGEVQAGQQILLHAGAGGTGSMNIQVARALGARVATTVDSDEKAALAAALGAELVIDVRSRDFVADALEWTDGRGVDVTVDNLGGPILKRSIAATRPLGVIVAMGFVAGVEATFDVRSFFFGQKQIRGSLMADIEDLEFWLAQVREGRISPVLDSTLPLEEAANAHRRLAAYQVKGSLALAPWD